jgi:uncharacterized membrane protein YeaQ/YmgE (transglycosylase-associated protein family)
MNWIAWIVIGGLAGWVASILTHNNNRMGILANIIVGIIGSFVGSFLLDLIGIKGMTGFNVYTFLVATFGAIVLLFLFYMIRGGRR